MNRARGTDRAVKRVTEALDALDRVIDARLRKDHAGGPLTEQLRALDLDRARLARELDAMRARARDLEDVNREAARRIGEAMGAIRAVIAANRN